MLTAICVIELILLIALSVILWLFRQACELWKGRLIELQSDYEACADSHRSSVRHYEQKIAELEKFISDVPEDAEAEVVPPGPGTSIPLPEAAGNLISRLKLRHTAHIAAYDFEQRKQDAANKKIGQMYRELQCSTGAAISTLRSQLESKLKVNCPVCKHIYRAPEPKLLTLTQERKKRLRASGKTIIDKTVRGVRINGYEPVMKKTKGVIQSVPAVNAAKQFKSEVIKKNGQANLRRPKRTTVQLIRDSRIA